MFLDSICLINLYFLFLCILTVRLCCDLCLIPILCLFVWSVHRSWQMLHQRLRCWRGFLCSEAAPPAVVPAVWPGAPVPAALFCLHRTCWSVLLAPISCALILSFRCFNRYITVRIKSATLCPTFALVWRLTRSVPLLQPPLRRLSEPFCCSGDRLCFKLSQILTGLCYGGYLLSTNWSAATNLVRRSSKIVHH